MLGYNYSNGSIVSVDMDVVGVMVAYCNPMCVCVLQSRECLSRLQYTLSRLSRVPL